jgi:hypothetical protein
MAARAECAAASAVGDEAVAVQDGMLRADGRRLDLAVLAAQLLADLEGAPGGWSRRSGTIKVSIWNSSRLACVPSPAAIAQAVPIGRRDGMVLGTDCATVPGCTSKAPSGHVGNPRATGATT